MLYSELIVWMIALFLNIYAIIYQPQIYQKTYILKIFHHILTQIWPFWLIIVISAIGTFTSVIFGDELLNTISHKERHIYNKHSKKYKLVIMVFLFAFSILLYKKLLTELGINI